MEARVYLEMSIISYLAALPSRDLVAAGRQQLTHEWWRLRRARFELVVSELVLLEAAEGDTEAARRRAGFLSGLTSLPVSAAAESLADSLLRGAALPPKARADALHIAIASTHGVAYLLTWNVRHIANAEKRSAVQRIASDFGFQCPILCTPDELLGEEPLDA